MALFCAEREAPRLSTTDRFAPTAPASAHPADHDFFRRSPIKRTLRACATITSCPSSLSNRLTTCSRRARRGKPLFYIGWSTSITSSPRPGNIKKPTAALGQPQRWCTRSRWRSRALGTRPHSINGIHRMVERIGVKVRTVASKPKRVLDVGARWPAVVRSPEPVAGLAAGNTAIEAGVTSRRAFAD